MTIRKKYINNHSTPIEIVKNFILKEIKIPDELKEYIGEYIFSKKFSNYEYNINVHYETYASSNTIGTTIYHKIGIQYEKFVMNLINYVLLKHYQIYKNILKKDI